ncbi:MAG TPA: CHAD domain-containing protein [Bryobacteraceae bacterium]|nr:CHAD domain-containing protein [Bryobacteraceae bacterium]
MKWKPSHSAIENAKDVLPNLVEKYFKAGRKAADGKRSHDELHEFRIKTKRFRYTLELVRPLYGNRLDRELEPVRDLQSVLGKLHDYHILASMLEGDHALRAKLERLTKKKLKDFHKEWAKFDADGQLKRWKSFLARPPAQSVTHSKRRARIGSTAAARRAGTKFAKNPTRITPNMTAA